MVVMPNVLMGFTDLVTQRGWWRSRVVPLDFLVNITKRRVSMVLV